MMSRYLRICFTCSVLLLAASITIRAGVLTLDAGVDSFQTVAAGTFVDSFPLPAGFFGSVGGFLSDAIATPAIHFGGLGGTCGLNLNPRAGVIQIPDNGPGESAPGAQHSVLSAFSGGLCDTQVERQSGVSFPNTGDSGTTPIQIRSLSLKSVSPLGVTFGGGSTNFFDVFVDLAPGPEPLGSMLLTRTDTFSGTFTSTLPVHSRLTFVNENPLGPSAVAQPERLDPFTSSGAFVVNPEPNLLPLEVGFLGLLVYAARSRWRQVNPHS